jgi:F420-dependent oxidoreductase-like protein
MTLKLGLGLDLWAGKGLRVPVEQVQLAERLGFDSVWTAEAYGSDAISPLAYLAACTSRIRLATGIIQVSARTPTATAMAMATVDALAGGNRTIIGLGLSGPQVVEGWYGAPWARPNARLRDGIAVMRAALRREAPLEYHGATMNVPYAGADATGMGKPLKSILHTAPLPIWLAAGGPRNVALAAEVCDGWIPMGFRPDMMATYQKQLDEGFKRRAPGDASAGERGSGRFEVAPSLTVAITDDVRKVIDAAKPRIAMYVGGMGHPEMNFHNQSMARVGYPEAAARIQELFLAGRRDEATAAVPDEFVDDGGLFGSPERITQRFAAWADCGATTLVVRTAHGPLGDDALELMADLAGTRSEVPAR